MIEFDINTKRQDAEHTKQPLNGVLRNMRWRGDPMLEGLNRIARVATSRHEPVVFDRMDHPRIDDLPEGLKAVVANGGTIRVDGLKNIELIRSAVNS